MWNADPITVLSISRSLTIPSRPFPNDLPAQAQTTIAKSKVPRVEGHPNNKTAAMLLTLQNIYTCRTRDLTVGFSFVYWRKLEAKQRAGSRARNAEGPVKVAERI